MSASKIAIVSVTNDLFTDRRVDRTCMVLHSLGFKVILLGRKKNQSPIIEPRLYKTKRFRLFFEKGPFFYMEINIRLFMFLLFRKVDLLVSNDLDTLLPNYIISGLKRAPLIYDSHEYFTGVPELEGRNATRKIWKCIEKFIFPKLRDVITVNESIADLYAGEYGVIPKVVRNIPLLPVFERTATRSKLGIDESKKMIILQGAGINIDRGAEEAVEAMKYIENAVLYIVGGGDVIPYLKKYVAENNLREKVFFVGRLTLPELYNYTVAADLGLTLDKDTSINYRYSLPNKLFDYIHAGTPVLASPLPELIKIINRYTIGECIENHNPEHIAQRVNSMISDKEKLKYFSENCKFAAKELNWENERKNLENVFKKYL